MTLPFQPKPLSWVIPTLLFSAYASASTVRDDVPYQYFRDLAENKGQFMVGRQSIPILNFSDAQVGVMFAGVSVPDMKIANRNTGVSALVGLQYLSTVNHGGVDHAQFGAEDNNPDLHHYSYRNSSNHPYPKTDLNPDYKIIRLKKLVTEIAPIAMAEAGSTASPYLDRQRFSHFVRVGSGRHHLQEATGNTTQIAGSYQFLVGGTPTQLEMPSSRIVQHQGLLSASGSVHVNHYGPMVTSTNPGDSGSPLLGFDRQQNRWVLVGHAQGLITKGKLNKNFDTNLYVISRPEFLRELEKKHLVTVHANHPHGNYTWQAEGDRSSRLIYRHHEVHHINLTNLSQPNGEDHAQSILFIGNPGVLELHSSINQGSGFLRFHNDFTVRAIQPDFSWLGSGIIVAPNKQVIWQVKNPKGDRLSKLGEGTLYVNGQGVNEGDISIGEGTVVLAQQPDRQNRKQAFYRIGLTSGRGILRLNGENQFNPDHFYFGFRGGRLDLNGYTQSFHRIQNSDDGARIVNHHRHHTATLLIKGEAGTPFQTFNGYLGETDPAWHNGRLNVTYSPNADHGLMVSGGMNVNGEVKVTRGTLLLSGRPTPHAYNRLVNQEVIWNHDWLNRQFRAQHFRLTDRAKLISGVHVERMQGDFHASGHSELQLGFIPHITPICLRSDHTGQTTCSLQGGEKNRDFANLPNTHIHGNVHLHDRSRLHLGHAHLQGKIFADHATHTQLDTPSQWTLPGSSRLGNVVMHEGAEINLHPWYHSLNQSQIEQGVRRFNRLTITGELSGSGQFNLLMNAAAGLSDWIDLQGHAQGNFALGLKNTGAEPDVASPLKLVQLSQQYDYPQLNIYLRHPFVDLGAYRYLLVKQGKQYRLYSPVKEALHQSGQDDANTRRRLQAEIEQYTTLSNTLSHQLQEKEQETTTWQNTLEAQQKIMQTERQNEAHYRRQAQRFWLEVRRRNALEQANNAKRKATHAEQEIMQLRQQIATQQQAMDTLRQSLTQTQQQAHSAQQQLNALASTENLGEIRQQTAQLCQTHHISTLDCHGALQAYLTEHRQQETNRLHQLIREQTTTQSQLTEQRRTKAQHVQQERQYAEQQQHMAGKWYYSWGRRHQARQQADAANRRAEALQQEIEKLDRRLHETNQQLATLQQRLTTLHQETIEIQLLSDQEALRNPQDPLQFASPRQAQWLSQYANTAVSANAAWWADVSRLHQQSHAKLIEPLANANHYVWLSRQDSRLRQDSDDFRAYNQKNRLTQLGVEVAMHHHWSVGVLFQHSHSYNQFDDNVSGNQRIQGITFYSKSALPCTTMFSLDVGYFSAQHRLTHSTTSTAFSRHVMQAGASIAKTWTPFGVMLQPSATLRYHHIAQHRYQLDLAKIEQPASHLVSYQLGLQLAKQIDLGKWQVRARLQTLYSRFHHQHPTVSVNQQPFNHRLAADFSHHLTVSLSQASWTLSAEAGITQGKQRSSHKQVGATIAYQW